MLNTSEIMQTLRMIDQEKLDVRTITMGISLLDTVCDDEKRLAQRVYDRITRRAERLVQVGCEIERDFGVPIVNKRISVTPAALITGAVSSPIPLAEALDRAAKAVGVDFIGGYTALVHKGMTKADRRLIESIPEALSRTDLLCASVNVASTRAGINMDAVELCGSTGKRLAEKTASGGGIGCAKFVVFANAVEDLEQVKGAPFEQVAETVKRTAFRITRIGQLVAREASERLQVPFGIVDLSLAPTPAVGDSVAHILEEMGLEKCGTHGSTAALALLNDAVKKGGVMASSQVGGLSGAFIPLSEDIGMIEAAECGALTMDKLEAMTCVCSVGLDMIAIPRARRSATG